MALAKPKAGVKTATSAIKAALPTGATASGGTLSGAKPVVNQGTLNGAIAAAAQQGGTADGGWYNADGSVSAGPDAWGNVGYGVTYRAAQQGGTMNSMPGGVTSMPSTPTSNGYDMTGANGNLPNYTSNSSGGSSPSSGGGGTSPLDQLLNSLKGGASSSGGTSIGNIDPNAGKTPVLAPSAGAYDSALSAIQTALGAGKSGVAQQLNEGEAKLNTLQQGGLQALQNVSHAGIEKIDAATNAGQGAINSALQSGTDVLNSSNNQVNNLFQQGQNNAAGIYDAAAGQYDPITQGAGGDFQNYRDLVTTDTAEQFKQFQESPAFRFALDEALKASNNTASAEGGLRSGAQSKALAKYASDYTSKNFMDFMNSKITNAANLAKTSLGSMDTVANILGQKAGTNANLTSQQANLNSAISQALSQLGLNAGLGSADFQSKQGTSAADFYKQQGLLNTQLRLGSMQNLTDLTKTGAEAEGSYASAIAQALQNNILGKGTVARYY